ncbi:DUF924-domain-containing protein [Polyplosphaeria fusca]|uniref:DUF924-domain-containing protein n=1 Tax=Polyplosphaeria fusca TaxID=682080 RepID=A0A9P4R9E2_9PLEO|nr:DUF924-domain-containing protein [Polyplosphaeria fusca]
MLARTALLLCHFAGTRVPRIVQQRAMSSYTLNKNIFNSSLYKDLQRTWFLNLSPSDKELPPTLFRRWFGRSPAFDSECRDNFAAALEEIGPEKLPNASAEPFIQEIHEAAQRNPSDGGADAAWTALSLVLLLDQMPRNIYRDNEGLKKVFGHYDKISYSLMNHLLSSKSPIRPDIHPMWRYSLAFRIWFMLPLVHSEHMDAHIKVDEMMAETEKDVRGSGNRSALMLLEGTIMTERKHRVILDQFGRYPHRNGALGRESTPEEKRFLAEGGDTFGVSQS